MTRTTRRKRFLPQGRWLPQQVWRQRHRGLTTLLWLHIPAVFGFGLIRGYTAGSSLLAASILLPAASIASVRTLSRNVRSASTSLGLVIGASLFVHLAGGATEAHFMFFVILALLTLYQTWLPLLVALGYVVIEHGVIGALDPRGSTGTSRRSSTRGCLRSCTAASSWRPVSRTSSAGASPSTRRGTTA